MSVTKKQLKHRINIEFRVCGGKTVSKDGRVVSPSKPVIRSCRGLQHRMGNNIPRLVISS